MGWSSRKSLLPEGNVTFQATLREFFLTIIFGFTFLSFASRVNEAVRGRGSGFRVLVIWGLKRMLDLCECGHMERNLGFSYPRILKWLLNREKMSLSIQNVV